MDLETKDGRTTFVPRIKDKKSQQASEAADLDLTVLALESPLADGFLSVSDGLDASLVFPNQSNVSFLDSHNRSALSTYLDLRNASLSDSHEIKAPLSVSHDPSAPSSDSIDPNETFVDLHESNASFSVSHDAKLLLPVSYEPRLSSPGKNKAVPQASGEG